MPGFERFMTKINEGMLLNNRFEVTCDKLGENSPILCSSANLPIQSIQFFEFKQTGHGLRIPNNFEYEPLTLTFLIDKNGSPYNEAYKWLDSIMTDEYQFNDMKSYMGEVKVVEYTPDDQSVGTWEYKDCWPSQITPREKTNEGTELDRFTITIVYNQMTYSS